MLVFGEVEQDIDGLVTHQYADEWTAAGYPDACTITYHIDGGDLAFLTLTDPDGDGKATTLKLAPTDASQEGTYNVQIVASYVAALSNPLSQEDPTQTYSFSETV